MSPDATLTVAALGGSPLVLGREHLAGWMLIGTSEVRHRRIALTLAGGMALGTITQFVLGALGPRITSDLGISGAAFGAVVTALFGVGFLLAPVAGGIVDRVGGRLTLVAVCLATGVAMAGLAVARDARGLAIVALGGGIAMALANPATNRLVSATVTPSRRGAVVGVTQAGVQGGALFAGLLAAAAAWVGGWRMTAALIASVSVVGSMVIAASLPDHAPVGPRLDRGSPTAGSGSLTVYALLMGAGAGAVFAHLALYAHWDLGLTEAAAGAIPAVFGIVGVSARVQVGRYADRLENLTPLLVKMSLGASAAVALVALGPRFGEPVLWAGVALFGMTGVAWPAVAMLAVVRTAGSAVGATTGKVSTGFFGGLLLTPALAGWAADARHGYTAVWWAVAGLYLVAATVAGAWVTTASGAGAGGPSRRADAAV